MTQTKLISTPKSNILVIGGIPEGAINLKVAKSYETFSTFDYNDRTITIPSGNWTILGKLSEITEEQLKPIIPMYEGYGYKLYDERPDILTKNIVESFHSLMSVNGIHIENQYEHPIYQGTIGKADYDYLEQQYIKAQHFINPLILIETNLKNTLVNL